MCKYAECAAAVTKWNVTTTISTWKWSNWTNLDFILFLVVSGMLIKQIRGILFERVHFFRNFTNELFTIVFNQGTALQHDINVALPHDSRLPEGGGDKSRS